MRGQLVPFGQQVTQVTRAGIDVKHLLAAAAMKMVVVVVPV
jgi:hypothetical protein